MVTNPSRPTVESARAAILSLVANRPRGTICPSEAARAVGGNDWRDAMPLIHATAATLAQEHLIELMQKGQQHDLAATIKGAYRIAPYRR